MTLLKIYLNKGANMPYIVKSDRNKFTSILTDLIKIEFKTKGELEFLLFAILKIYMSKRKVCYSELHDTVYACQHVADEFRRRFLDIRENQALESNGDI